MSYVDEDIQGDGADFYRASFGKMPDKTIYSDGMRNFTKAVDSGVADGSAGFAPIPVVWDPYITDVTRKQCPVQNLIVKRSNMGKVANYYRLTARGAATWQSEDDALDEIDDTRKSESSDIKILRITGRVTGFAQAAGMGFRNALQEEMREKTISLQMELENNIINGDNSSNSKEPDGLINLLTSNNENIAGAVTLSDITNLLDECALDLGTPSLLITDYKTRTDIVQQMSDLTRYVDPVNIGWGLSAVAFNGPSGVVPLISSIYMPNASGDRRIIALDTQYIEDRTMLETSFSDLAKTNDSSKFFLRRYSTLISRFSEGCGQLTGITD